jgi:hypothetical protein
VNDARFAVGNVRLYEIPMRDAIGVREDQVVRRRFAHRLVQDPGPAKSFVTLACVLDRKWSARRKCIDECAHFGRRAVIGNEYLKIARGLAAITGQNQLQRAHGIVNGNDDGALWNHVLSLPQIGSGVRRLNAACWCNKSGAEAPHSMMKDMASGYFDLPGAKR